MKESSQEKVKMCEKTDSEEGFHCFCVELLGRMVGKFPDIDVLLTQWRRLREDVKSEFKKRGGR